MIAIVLNKGSGSKSPAVKSHVFQGDPWLTGSGFKGMHLIIEMKTLNLKFQIYHQFLIFFFFFLYLFIYLASPGLSCSMQDLVWFPDQGLNLGHLHWEHEGLATGPPGKFQISDFVGYRNREKS